MKLKMLSLFLLTSIFLSAQKNSIDVLHYKFNIGLNDVHDTIHGVAEIKVKLLKASDELSLDLVNAGSNGKGMKTGKIVGQSVKETFHKNEVIRIIFDKKFNAGDTVNVIIPYSGIPKDGLIIEKTKFGRRGFFADNWPDRGHNWIPCHEDPADKASVEFIVTAPEHYQVVANGIQVEETSLNNGFKLTHWKEDVPISPKVMVIGVADFAVNLAGFVNDKIPVYSWVYPENKEKGFYDYAIAKDILPFFINNVGPYGYKKLANVQSRTRFGGLENANTIFYYEGSVSGTRRSEGIVAHEIAHQWFGNMATEKSFGHLWLSEGFATYFTILYFARTYNRDTAIAMLKKDRAQIISFAKTSNRPIVDTLEWDYMKLLNTNSYQKGGWVLHMLRKESGDSVFWRSIRKYYATYAGSVAGTEDLQKIFEEFSGKNLDQFFKQWLYSPGIPVLNVKWEYNAATKKLKAEIKQLQNNLFEFPLEIRIVLGKGNLYHRVNISKQITTFEVTLDETPTELVLDPDTALLFEEKK